MNLKFSGRGLAFLAHYKAKVDIRYYLCGVYLRPMPAAAGGGVLGAATNGHVMGMWHDKSGTIDRPAILRISDPLAKACAATKRGTETSLVLRDERLTCMLGDDETYIQPNPLPVAGKNVGKSATVTVPRQPWEVDGTYPRLGRVLPDPAAATLGASACMNVDYLGLLAKSVPRRRHGGKDYGLGVFMRQEHASGVILVACPSVPEMTAIIMPIHDTAAMPPWLAPFVASEKAVTP